MRKLALTILGIVFALLLTGMSPTTMQDRKSSDSEQLGKAIEYFQSGKFHEALLIFDKLDRRYKLNPRFRAFLAVCYYYDWNDEKVCEYLDSIIPQLEPFAPHERSIYYFLNAESHFNLGQYKEAVTYYEQMTNVCYNNEKGDALYRLGYCYLFNDDKETAHDYFESALEYYRKFRTDQAVQPRIAQIEKMVRGLTPNEPTQPEEFMMARDTLRSKIINDIDLSDIYEHEIYITPEE
ncbi:MAG: tetratricopeptide repeat protein [Prevotella sp.]|nr:tetratricopeptide repeat protein [Prevotella sp.]